MKLRVPVVVSLIVFLGVAFAHGKKLKVAGVFQTAHTIFVQSKDGDASQPNVSDADRTAIQQVTQQTMEWKRYAFVDSAQKADLVIVIHKGHSTTDADQLTSDLRQSPVAPPGHAGMQPTPGITPAMSMPSMPAGDFAQSDMLQVYTANAKGKLKGPIWSQQSDGGLDAPTVQLFQQLKSAVDNAYPLQPQTSQAPAQ